MRTGLQPHDKVAILEVNMAALSRDCTIEFFLEEFPWK